MIMALLGLMLASAALPVAGATGGRRDFTSATASSLPPMPNSYFEGILYSTVSNETANSTFFAPFVYSQANFTVSGKFMKFLFNGAMQNSGILGIYDVSINQIPLGTVNETVYKQFQVMSAGNFTLGKGVIGPLFYAFTNNTLLIAHDDPQALIQVYTYQSGVTVEAALPADLRPNSQFTIESSVTQKGTVAMMFNDTDLAGYIVSQGSTFNSTLITGGGFFVTKTIPAGSYLNTFSVPAGSSYSASALSTIAQGMKHNTISYYAALTLQNGRAAVDAAYINNVLRVSYLSVASGSISMGITAVEAGVPNTVVLLVSSSVLNGSDSKLVIQVNGAPVTNVSSLPSLISPYGDMARQNTTMLGSYTIVTVYSPVPISSLKVYVPASRSPNVLLTSVIPLTGAFAVVAVATVLLFRRKNRGVQ